MRNLEHFAIESCGEFGVCENTCDDFRGEGLVRGFRPLAM
jgi:hypothetical protein